MLKVSIITVSFNAEKTLRDTIESILHQTYPCIEYIVVDGASSDGTIDIIKEYEEKFNGNLKWVSEKDNGIYDAMNKGICMSTGDVVGILNSDDYFTSNDVLEKAVKLFADSKIDAVYGDIHFIHNENPKKCVRYYSSRLFRPMWLRFGFMPAHPSFYVRKKIYDIAGGYKTDYEIGSDYEMMVRLFYKYKIKAKYINKDFVTMRTGGASNKNLSSRLILMREDVRACRENGVYTNLLMMFTKPLYKIFGFRLWAK